MSIAPRSLAGRLVLLLLCALIVSQLLTALVFVDERRAAMRSIGQQQVISRTASLVPLLEETPGALHDDVLRSASNFGLAYTIDADPAVDDAAPPDEREERFGRWLGNLLDETREVRVRVYEPEARLFGFLWPGEPGLADAPTFRPPEPLWLTRNPDAARRPLPERPVALALSVPLDDGRWLNAAVAPTVADRGSLLSTLAPVAIMALAIVVIVVWSVRRITRPLRALAASAERFGRGETVPRLPEEGPEEVARTLHAFNTMQERLTRFVSDRTRMLAAISHDLRTPITALRLRAEFVEEDETREKLIATLDEMKDMTEAALSFAREDAASEETRAVDLASLAESVADDLADLGSPVSCETQGRVVELCRPVSLRRALRNLIENAVRYGGGARVVVGRDASGNAAIAVEDEGPGIPAARLEEVFEPFVRLESSRSQETGGVGLGLAIARSIVRSHGGELVLANRSGGGLTASIVLPRGAN